MTSLRPQLSDHFFIQFDLVVTAPERGLHFYVVESIGIVCRIVRIPELGGFFIAVELLWNWINAPLDLCGGYTVFFRNLVDKSVFPDDLVEVQHELLVPVSSPICLRL